ncbi:4-(cytidine 5'-diphospho)-2-C-methyl-D-erythritol kinase [Bartonella apihabitans]|uniref:4-(cytidine 5'-diphospho)-2-C-methyl-D-erythritol kinase n=1 Tax=uncultured Bartonella sp. TaxID=104108 RepID=UPI0025EE4054|nr:4-(cytidine 5'-diphospho)-2-C-methyl-D-erythritol kinase [Bartonella apihabitans]WLT09079.1 4-(cytidine 5'-diphospho)-2-C-methyl-D-erythritol kinase [Bartonella apihabitans]
MPSEVAKSATIVTPIKINLALHIVGERSDGYHLLDSLVCFSFEGDVLFYKPAKTNSFSIVGPRSVALSANADNLVSRARDLFVKNFPLKSEPCQLILEKNLPVASGIGGGSGDAAGVFALLKQQWQIEASDQELFEIGLTLGADVPMCLSAFLNRRSLRVSGIGEKLQPVDCCKIPMVLVNHGQSISTPEIFKLLGNRKSAALDIDVANLSNLHSLVNELKKTHNDLYECARSLAPELDDVLEILDGNGALLSRMSGSGATCFGIYENIKKAEEAASKIKSQKPDWFVKAVETTGKIDE